MPAHPKASGGAAPPAFPAHRPPNRRGLLAAGLVLALLAFPGAVPGDDPYAPFVEPGFPFITTTVEAGHLGAAYPDRNLAVRGVVVQLGNDAYAAFDPDLLRLSVAWHGEFLMLTTMAQVSYQEAGNKRNEIPKILGAPVVATGLYPGWQGETLRFEDPRPPGLNPDDPGRGPLPVEMGRWNGLYVAGDRVVLAYTVQGIEVLEQPGSVRAGEEIGLVRTFRIAETNRPLALVVAEVGNGQQGRVAGNRAEVAQAGGAVTVAGVAGLPQGAALRVTDHRYITLHLPAGLPASTFSVVAWKGPAARAGAVEQMLAQPFPMAEAAQGGPAHWPGEVVTQGTAATDTDAFVVDELGIPLPNPWRRNVRLSGLDFFSDGRGAFSTFEGDVWIASGFDRPLERLVWRRFASGLYEPMSLRIVDDRVYVFGREGIVRLSDVNGDGEADFYENFSNLPIQARETREYPMDMAERPGGGFYLGRGSALDLGPKTGPGIMPGFRAGSRHSGSIIEISADGRSARLFATGFREPFLGVHPRTGLVTASDQQGNFVPSTPLYVVEDGGYYGVPATAHRSEAPPVEATLTWIPHQVDRSGASQAWVTGGRMGPLDEALVHLSYGEPAAFRVYVDSTTAGGVQGGLIRLPGVYQAPLMKGQVHPVDGQLYVAGFKVYDSNAPVTSGLTRIRYTGRASRLPAAVRAGRQGLILRFDQPLDPASVEAGPHRLKRWNYARTERYGSGHFRPDGSPGQEDVPVAAAFPSRDARAVLLVVPDMQEVMQMEVAYRLRAADGTDLADTLYLTVNQAADLPLEREGFGEVDWQAAAQAAGVETVAALETASVELGATLYQRLGCMGCHSTDGTLQGKSGPTFKGLHGSMRTFTDGSMRQADEAYLRESILDPVAHIVQGYAEGMPSYQGVLSDAEVASLVLFVKSLGP